MTQDEIIRMARQACAPNQTFNSDEEWVKRFAALVAAHEREACAKACEEEASRAKWNWDNDISGNQPFWNGAEQLASSCATAIRARNNND